MTDGNVIQYPGKHDVMLGRGGESNYHSGNISFRHIVFSFKERFRLGSRVEKSKVIDEVVEAWRNLEPPGRFVAKKKASSGEVFWHDVGDDLARKRAAKSLSEWTPNQANKDKELTSDTYNSKKRSRSTDSPTYSVDSFGDHGQGYLYQDHEGHHHGSKRQNTDLPSLAVAAGIDHEVATSGRFPQHPKQQHPYSLPDASLYREAKLAMVAPPASSFLSSSDCSLPSQSQIGALPDVTVMPLSGGYALNLPTAAELSATVFEDDERKPEAQRTCNDCNDSRNDTAFSK